MFQAEKINIINFSHGWGAYGRLGALPCHLVPFSTGAGERSFLPFSSLQLRRHISISLAFFTLIVPVLDLNIFYW
jgi:hypothetical protein